ncbi:FkbM family methyltransferase [Flavobacterium solisilvae]|uniref:FkbM family methyltransferase n=1 Tax=Flavobacterium solisilvae TaxID=1852019 RepID=A0ABX1QW91_9FLAO|nr:FkbM family methyltransferase [Flavobacterium solisilvae]NMH25320.1 FkbM family methyltransferase [Flavobacterium solisilvae]
MLREKRKITKNEYDDLVFLYEKLKHQPNVIFDCGANIGYVTYQLSSRFKSSKIYSFEPNPSVFNKLKKSVETNKNISVNNVGIGDEKNNLEFYKNNNTGTSSFLEPNDFHKSNLARKYQKLNVPIISIGDFCLENNIDKIDILKLDIEGYELKALKGCKQMLENNKIDFIFSEVNLIPTYEGQCLMEEIISFLRSFNYIPYNFYGINENKLREAIITNILFISNDVAKKLVKENGENSVYVKN